MTRPRRTPDTGYPGAPRWVKVGGIAAGLLVVIMLLGGHGPWHHMSGMGGSTSGAGVDAAAPDTAKKDGP